METCWDKAKEFAKSKGASSKQIKAARKWIDAHKDELKEHLAVEVDAEEELPTLKEVKKAVKTCLANEDMETCWDKAKEFAKSKGATGKQIKAARKWIDAHKDELKEHLAVEIEEEDDELPTAEEVLGHCDTDNNGRLNAAEAKTCLTAAVEGGQMTKKEARKAGRLLLKNAFISEANFVKAAAKEFNTTEAEVQKVYDQMDKNDDGKLSYKECKKAIKWAVKNGKMKAEDIPKAKEFLTGLATIGKAGITNALKQW
jgi:Ca2+-binding EF-hand superfamily protein